MLGFKKLLKGTTKKGDKNRAQKKEEHKNYRAKKGRDKKQKKSYLIFLFNGATISIKKFYLIISQKSGCAI